MSRTGMPTPEYLRVAYALISIFDSLPGLVAVKSDMIGNADKIWRRQNSFPGATLQQLCAVELEGPAREEVLFPRGRDGTVCTSLLWLQRALRLVETMLTEFVRGQPVRDSVAVAYGRTLKRHHNFMMRGAFGVAINAAPSRKDFLRRISTGMSEERALRVLAKLTPEMSKVTEHVHSFLVQAGVEAR